MHFDPSVTLFVLFSLFLLLSLILLPLWYFARQRSLHGVVTDQDGWPLAEATVKLTDILTTEVRVCHTNRQGRFDFEGLSTIADYEIAVVHDQHWSRPITLWQDSSQCRLHLQLQSRRSEEVAGGHSRHCERALVILVGSEG